LIEDPTKRSVPAVPALSATRETECSEIESHPPHHGHNEQSPQKLALLALTAMGVVFGDIGTSPLYALRECFAGEHGYTISPENVYGILSLFFWSLSIIISIKYVLFIMRADNRGEGGILALEALARRASAKLPFKGLGTVLTLMGIFGATLLYGDGIITPAISVLSALEGITVAAPGLSPYVVPSTCAVLLGLFLVQRFGTAKIGIVFGPITLLWFVILGVLGVAQIAQAPSILSAINPMYAVRFFAENGWKGFLVLGTVFLCVTGGEAMYADMGHFGRSPIKYGWFFIVWPSLILNYFGQGALILRDPSAISSPFYNMAPAWALYPLIALATAATVIASQALISGVFSLTKQAIQLGFSPRMEIIHTSKNEIGQIYVPAVNWALLIGAVVLVIAFQSSSGLAHAYGIAVSLTMLITTFLAVAVARYVWKWSVLSISLLCIPLLIVDVAFFAANAVKIFHGGYIPLVLAAACHFLMVTWIRGRQLLGEELAARAVSLRTFMEEMEAKPPMRVPGTAVFMTGAKDGVPFSLVNNLKHNKILHERVVFITFVTREIPYVDAMDRVTIEELKNGMWRVSVKIGFMDDADVQAIIHQACAKGLWINISETTFFLGREVVLATHKRGMALWREKLFAFMGKNAQSPAAFFNIPPNQVIEIGMQVEI
jgi:KUP system potassium uptake protein